MASCVLHTLTLLCTYLLFDAKSVAETTTNATSVSDDLEILEVKEELNRVWEAIAELQRQANVRPDDEVIANLTNILGLSPDGEGNLWKVSYASKLNVHLEGSPSNSSRAASTTIFHLSTATESKYVWHQFIDSVGLAFWHLGSTKVYHLFHSDGHHEVKRLGDVLKDGAAEPMIVVPPGTWYVEELDRSFGSYVLESKIMTPGWSIEHFIKGEQADVEALFPQHSRIIKKFRTEEFENLNEVD